MNVINSETTLSTIAEYMDPSSASQFRRCERRMKAVMDSETYWGEPTGYVSRHSRCEQPVEPYHASPGLSKIIYRSSYQEWRCVSCSSVSNIPVHPFYGTVVCRSCCYNSPEYRVMGHKAACKKYFVKEEDTAGVLKMRKSSGVFRVLEHQVKRVAEEKLGHGPLRSRLAKRSARSDTIHSNKAASFEKRLRTLTFSTNCTLFRLRSRIDPPLLQANVLVKLSSFHRLYGFITGDLLMLRVKSHSSPRVSSERLVDLACLLSYCQRNGVLMDDYKTLCPGHDDFNIRGVFTRHCNDGVHFYDYMSEYVRSIESLMDRSRSVLAHTASIGDEITTKDRLGVSRIVCSEEGVPLDADAFDEYIRFGVGDPVLIARECRKIAFLCNHGYNEDFFYYNTVCGLCPHQSLVYARRQSLSRCRGFPIMNRLFTDCRVSGLNIMG
jgi:hypothetical protein